MWSRSLDVIICVHLNYGYCIIKHTCAKYHYLANIDAIMCPILTKKLIWHIISLQLSGDMFGRDLTTGPASNGLLSYYPEYISFGEFLAGKTMKKLLHFKYFIDSLSLSVSLLQLAAMMSVSFLLPWDPLIVIFAFLSQT